MRTTIDGQALVFRNAPKEIAAWSISTPIMVRCSKFVMEETVSLIAKRHLDAHKSAPAANASNTFATQNFAFKNVLLEDVKWNAKRKPVSKYAEAETAA